MVFVIVYWVWCYLPSQVTPEAYCSSNLGTDSLDTVEVTNFKGNFGERAYSYVLCQLTCFATFLGIAASYYS